MGVSLIGWRFGWGHRLVILRTAWLFTLRCASFSRGLLKNLSGITDGFQKNFLELPRFVESVLLNSLFVV